MKPERARPLPPRPQFLRRPRGPFGWLDARLLHDRWLQKMGTDGIATLALLALAADGRGASFYGRRRMAETIGLSIERLDRALERLVRLGLLDFRPWKRGQRDGVWQVLSVDDDARPGEADERSYAQGEPLGERQPEAIADVIKRLGIGQG